MIIKRNWKIQAAHVSSLYLACRRTGNYFTSCPFPGSLETLFTAPKEVQLRSWFPFLLAFKSCCQSLSISAGQVNFYGKASMGWRCCLRWSYLLSTSVVSALPEIYGRWRVSGKFPRCSIRTGMRNKFVCISLCWWRPNSIVRGITHRLI